MNDLNNGLNRLKNITENRVESIRLLESALDKNKFLEYLSNYFDPVDLKSEVDFSSFQERLSENEFQQPHYQYHYPALWSTLDKANFTPQEAKNPIKWLSITYQAIENDIIHPHYLAFLDKSRDGKKNIHEALRLAQKGNDNKLFEVCRAILRRTFGNIKERRGNGVYQDIPFAIAWWKIYLAKEISKTTSLEEKDIIQFFFNYKDHYTHFILNMKGRLTIIADITIRNALMLYIINKKTTGTAFKKVMGKIGIESSWRSMGALNAEENKKIIESLVT